MNIYFREVDCQETYCFSVEDCEGNKLAEIINLDNIWVLYVDNAALFTTVCLNEIADKLKELNNETT